MANAPSDCPYFAGEVSLGSSIPDGRRRLLAELPLTLWDQIGPYQVLGRTLYRVWQGADSQVRELTEVELEGTWCVLQSESESSGQVAFPPSLSSPKIPQGNC
jgi:hypothetical protein